MNGRNVPLVTREQQEAYLKSMNVENLKVNSEAIRDEKEGRKFKIDIKQAERIVAAVAISLSIIGSAYYTFNSKDPGVSEEVIAQLKAEEARVGSGNYDENNAYAPDNLIFDKVVRDMDGNYCRVVVNSNGSYAFVSYDYKDPFYELNGISAEEMAKNMGFDNATLSSNRSR